MAHRRNERGEMCEVVKFTRSCTGCFEGGECMGLAHNYRFDSKAGCHVGAGCEECGYTGKRRQVLYIPLSQIKELNNSGAKKEK